MVAHTATVADAVRTMQSQEVGCCLVVEADELVGIFTERNLVVRVLHAGSRGPGQPTLDEARRQAGCWDNELTPAEVERAVKAVSQPRAAEAAR